MEQTQNTQNTQHTEYTKCSRCKKIQIISKFGFKKNRDEFKPCFRCRKNPEIPEITNQPIISSQSSSEDKDVQINEEEIQKHDDVSNLITSIDEQDRFYT